MGTERDMSLFTWIHNCPQRRDVVQQTISSAEASDISDWRVWCHDEDLISGPEIEHWWEERLLEAAKQSEFFLRLEDDVLVCKDIEEMIKNWSALNLEDFACGSLFRFFEKDRHQEEINEDTDRILTPLQLAGPAIVFKSEHVPEIVKNIRLAKKEGRFVRLSKINFDASIFNAVHNDMGMNVYLHRQSLVDCIGENGVSSHTRAHSGYFSANFRGNNGISR